MPRFCTGDELGKIKLIKCTEQDEEWRLDEQAAHIPVAHAQFTSGEAEANSIKSQGIQRLASTKFSDQILLAAARSNGTVTAFSINVDNANLAVTNEWKDSRFKAGHTFVGLDGSSKGLFWCTSNGALGLAPLEGGTLSSSFQKASLPMRLKSWRLSPSGDTFAYGGEEVDLSVWDTDRAFQSSGTPPQGTDGGGESAGKKRKRGNELLPNEIWRAKNLPNDSLSLRQPIHIRSLTYLPQSSSNSTHIVTGTETGDVRRYDTRSARRPVANWTGVGKIGGVGVVQAGIHEHELFVSDNGTNLSALDLRNGRVIYSYKKLQGAITSIAPLTSGSPGLLGSTCRDRYFRLHTTFSPPEVAGKQQDERGDVAGSLYMKSAPIAVIALSDTSEDRSREDGGDLEDDEDEMWAGMENVDDSEEDDGIDENSAKPRRKRKNGKADV